MSTKKPVLKSATAVKKTTRTKNEIFRSLDVDPRRVVRLEEPTSIIEVSFENVAGNTVLFTVDHSNKVVLKENIADMPVTLQSKKPKLRVVSAPAEAHFKFKEWLQLSKLSAPGTWYYLGVPKDYERAAKIYAKIDPINRVFRKKPKARKPLTKTAA